MFPGLTTYAENVNELSFLRCFPSLVYAAFLRCFPCLRLISQVLCVSSPHSSGACRLCAAFLRCFPCLRRIPQVLYVSTTYYYYYYYYYYLLVAYYYYLHLISPKTPAPQYVHIERKKRKEKNSKEQEWREQIRPIKMHWPSS